MVKILLDLCSVQCDIFEAGLGESARVWESVSFAPVVSLHGDVICFCEHGADSFKGHFAWRQHTEKKLRRIVRVGHDRIQGGKIVVTYVDLVGSK